LADAVLSPPLQLKRATQAQSPGEVPDVQAGSGSPGRGPPVLQSTVPLNRSWQMGQWTVRSILAGAGHQ